MTRNAAAIFVALLAAFTAGWLAAGWQRDSSDLLIERTAAAAGERARSESLAIASRSGRELEKKLEALRIAIPESLRTEVLLPVFNNRCLSDDYVSMYNDAAAKAERAISGKPENALPGHAATFAGQ